VRVDLKDITLRPVGVAEEPRFKALLEAHHYLGAVAKIGHTIWYVATWRGQWAALLVVSAAAWKCAARDRWIGWDQRHQYDRLHLIGNNARFLILPEWHTRNLASRVLGLCERRIAADWRALRPPAVAARDVCRSASLPRHELSGGQLAGCR
jgi:hypothetical protein